MTLIELMLMYPIGCRIRHHMYEEGQNYATGEVTGYADPFAVEGAYSLYVRSPRGDVNTFSSFSYIKVIEPITEEPAHV